MEFFWTKEDHGIGRNDDELYKMRRMYRFRSKFFFKSRKILKKIYCKISIAGNNIAVLLIQITYPKKFEITQLVQEKDKMHRRTVLFPKKKTSQLHHY